jgi:hypothetical protein
MCSHRVAVLPQATADEIQSIGPLKSVLLTINRGFQSLRLVQDVKVGDIPSAQFGARQNEPRYFNLLLSVPSAYRLHSEGSLIQNLLQNNVLSVLGKANP